MATASPPWSRRRPRPDPSRFRSEGAPRESGALSFSLVHFHGRGRRRGGGGGDRAGRDPVLQLRRGRQRTRWRKRCCGRLGSRRRGGRAVGRRHLGPRTRQRRRSRLHARPWRLRGRSAAHRRRSIPGSCTGCISRSVRGSSTRSGTRFIPRSGTRSTRWSGTRSICGPGTRSIAARPGAGRTVDIGRQRRDARIGAIAVGQRNPGRRPTIGRGHGGVARPECRPHRDDASAAGIDHDPHFLPVRIERVQQVNRATPHRRGQGLHPIRPHDRHDLGRCDDRKARVGGIDPVTWINQLSRGGLGTRKSKGQRACQHAGTDRD